MRMCFNCGKTLGNNENFCPKCGMSQIPNNNIQVKNNDDGLYGKISLIIGICSLVAPIFLYLVNYQMVFNIFTYFLLLVAEIVGVVLGAKSKKGGLGILLNISRNSG